MAIACDAASVTKSSACFACIPAAQLQQLDVFLLQQGAGLLNFSLRQLAAGGAAFRPLGPKQLLATIVYSLAVAAGTSKDPKTLAKLAACFVCSSERLLDDTETFLLASANMGSPTDPKALMPLAKNYGGLYGQTDLIKAYLYNAIALSAPTDPKSLFSLAACFMCLPTERLKAIRNYLLCQIFSNGGFSGQGPNLIPPGSIYNGSSQFSVNIMAGVCYNICWGAHDVSAFLAVSGQTFQSSGAGTCTALYSSVDTVLTLTGTVAGTTVTATVNSCSCGVCSPRPINFKFANDGVAGGNTVATWNTPPPGVTATELWTSPDNITYSKVATVAAPGTTASVAQPAAGAFLWGKIRHVSGTFFSSFTPAIEVSGLLSGLVSYWNLDNILTSPNGAIDNFTGGNNLGNHAGAGNAVVQLAGGGKVGGAGDWHTNLAGSPYLKSAANPVNLKLGGGASMTGAMWVQFKANGNNAGIFGLFNPANDYLLWFNTPGGNLEWNVRNGAGVNTPIVIGNQTLNVWHFIVVGFDNANNQIFYSIDGAARVNAACAGASTQGVAVNFELGNYADGFPSDIYMDEVGWWNRVLSAAEITFLYNGGNGKTLPL